MHCPFCAFAEVVDDGVESAGAVPKLYEQRRRCFGDAVDE
jgi:hypothetical protein